MADIPSPVQAVTPLSESTAVRHGLAWSARHLLPVPRATGALLLRHWPVLLALIFVGFAARRGLVVVAVQASKLDGVFGFLVFALVPVAVMTALVLMLRVLSRSLPGMPVTGEPGARFRALAHVASVLLPFIAVYASYGYYQQDRSHYLYQVWVDENLNNADLFTDPSKVNMDERLPFQLSTTLVAVVAVAVLLRFLLGLGAARSWGWIGFLRGYVEIVVISLPAIVLTGLFEPFTAYLEQRRAYHWGQDAWQGAVERLGPLEQPVRGLGTFLAELFLSLDTVLVVPIAWLIVATVVYGQSLGTPPLSARAMARARRATVRWARLPGPVRKVTAGGTASLRESAAPLAHALRLLAHAGKVPILLYCLLFTAVQTLPAWLWELERSLIGPQDVNFGWIPLSGPLSTVNQAITMVLQLCLVAATVDGVLRVRSADQPEARVPDQVDGAVGDPHGDRLDAGGRGEVGHAAVTA